MSFVYILKTGAGTKYIGSTINLKRRLLEHTAGKVLSTKYRRPLCLFAYRVFDDIKEATQWEKKYKRSHGQLERDLSKGLFCVL